VFWKIVIKLGSTILGSSAAFGELFCSDHAADLSTGAFTSYDLNVDSLLEFRGLDFGGGKSELSWEVLVQNSDFAARVISEMSGLSSWVKELNRELEVGLPFLVIDDVDSGDMFVVSLLQSDDLLVVGVISWGLGSSINSYDTESHIGVHHLLHDRHFHEATALCYGVVKAFESELLVFLLDLADMVLNLSSSALEIKEIFVASEVVGFSCSESLEEGNWLERSHKLFGVELSYLFCSQNLLIELNDSPSILLAQCSCLC